MAYKAGKNGVVWAIGGGVLALVVTTIVVGLAQATFIPYCTGEIATFRLKVAGVAVVLVLCLGWLFTGTLHEHIRELLKRGTEPRRESAAPGACARRHTAASEPAVKRMKWRAKGDW